MPYDKEGIIAYRFIIEHSIRKNVVSIDCGNT